MNAEVFELSSDEIGSIIGAVEAEQATQADDYPIVDNNPPG